MKATLKFNLHEEQAEFEAAVKGSDALLLINTLLMEVRSLQNHNAGAFKDCDLATMETLEKWVTDHIEEYQLPEL
jgi:hypothetical protein